MHTRKLAESQQLCIPMQGHDKWANAQLKFGLLAPAKICHSACHHCSTLPAAWEGIHTLRLTPIRSPFLHGLRTLADRAERTRKIARRSEQSIVFSVARKKKCF
ncbi:hypothetical protein PoB_005066000 [Plakobranchus ocellatus]|uniref:Uncharacterized protein n=1 Tax=Plakobranchus ocellatus TaxID=259542 RepID=A0AAV4BXV8_9GAST|nr:hypothetical protein PoB_005066000 [Plakobranchus ocellatus]